MYKNAFIYIIVSALLFLFLASGYSQPVEENKEQPTYQMTGTVVTFTEDRIVIIDEVDEKRHNFIIDKKTIINGKISEGARVTITYIRKLRNRKLARLTALTIEVEE
jgi:hypothetical protein